jgi:V/A-type H+-transporting ATPase subunit K
MFKIIVGVVLVCSIALPMLYFRLSEKKKDNFKIAIGFNSVFFFGTLLVASVMMFSGNASAATTAATATEANWKYLAAALSTGLSCIGAGIAVASAASSAIGAISEDSTIMGKALIFVALAESIALYGLLISFSIL